MRSYFPGAGGLSATSVPRPQVPDPSSGAHWHMAIGQEA